MASEGTAQQPPSHRSPAKIKTVVKVRDLKHVRSLAITELANGNRPEHLDDSNSQVQYEISSVPIGDVVEMVAALITKISNTNDRQTSALNNSSHRQHASQAAAEAAAAVAGSSAAAPNGAAVGLSPLSTSVLAFHGKNIPGITIFSYLSRIHKYCPTTYEVFLSLLVYFDRMTERINSMVLKKEEERRQREQVREHAEAAKQATADCDVEMPDADSASIASNDTKFHDQDHGPADDGREKGADSAGEPNGVLATGANGANEKAGPSARLTPDATASATVDPADSSDGSCFSSTFFVVDSFNVHRLIIAGVSCSSKFFSDVFYTNSRYAKVGGLPLTELNHLEMQFLLLNDFRLSIPVSMIETYATMLVEFYMREVIMPELESE